MPPRSSVLLVVVVLLTHVLLSGQGSTRADIQIGARTLQPGELVVVTLEFDAAPTSVRIHAFDDVVTAFPLGDGRWRALVGIDLGQAPGTYVMTIEARTPATTTSQTRDIVVRPKRFATRRLRVPADFVDPPAELRDRINDEAAFLQRVYEHPSPERLWSEPFVRPVPGAANSRFGTRSVFNGKRRNPHSGTDFASGLGTPIKAPNAGRIVAARELFFSGNTVIIDHGLGVFSTLAHLSRIDVREGEKIEAGLVVGLVGATGRVTGPHLHWALRVSSARVDPMGALALIGEAGVGSRPGGPP